MHCCSCGQPLDPMGSYHSNGLGDFWCYGCAGPPQGGTDDTALTVDEPPAEREWAPNPFGPEAKRTPLT